MQSVYWKVIENIPYRDTELDLGAFFHNRRIDIYNLLDSQNIEYIHIEHPPVYTIDEVNKLNLDNDEKIVKNLFLRDNKKRNYYLVVMNKKAKVNLNELKNKLNSLPLTFASENDLYKYLKLSKGAVTPLGVLNNEENNVIVIIDNNILNYDIIGVHPNDNSATVWLNITDLIKLIRKNSIIYLDI